MRHDKLIATLVRYRLVAAAPLAGAALCIAACGANPAAGGDTDGEGTTSHSSTTGAPSATDNGPTPATTDDPDSTDPDSTNSTNGTGDPDSTGDESSSTETGSATRYDGNIIIPELLDANDFELVMDEGTHRFIPSGMLSDTAGYNGELLAPTMVWTQGENISISVTNNMAKQSTTHWHGAHVSPENDGGPHQMIAANGGVWEPAFEVLNVAATMWYHPHLHEDTANQVRSGLSGFIIVRDAVEAALDLPRQYGVDDLVLVLQDKQLNNYGVLMDAPNAGNTMTVNGAADAYRGVPAQYVRLRLLNGSLEMAYHLAFADGREFHVIGNDLGLLAAPVAVTSLRIAPAERYELAIDFGDDEGDSVTLMALNSQLGMGIPGGPWFDEPGLPGTDFDVIRFDVQEPTGTGTTELPATLVPPVIPSGVGAVPHSMVMAEIPSGYSLNGTTMQLNVINEYVEGGTTEIWSIENQTSVAHPFHIHDIHFYIVDHDADSTGPAAATPPQDWEAGPKDTVLVLPGETVRFIAEFDDFAFDPADGIAQAAYMYHCHILQHEDGGMMGQFAVCPQGEQTCAP